MKFPLNSSTSFLRRSPMIIEQCLGNESLVSTNFSCSSLFVRFLLFTWINLKKAKISTRKVRSFLVSFFVAFSYRSDVVILSHQSYLNHCTRILPIKRWCADQSTDGSIVLICSLNEREIPVPSVWPFVPSWFGKVQSTRLFWRLANVAMEGKTEQFDLQSMKRTPKNGSTPRS